MFQLNGKIAFVTGAATGLGQAIAIALAKNGADVVITDRLDDTEKLIQKVGRRVRPTHFARTCRCCETHCVDSGWTAW